MQNIAGAGPTFKLQLGKEIIVDEHIPKRAAMAFSKAFNDQLTAYPRSSAFTLDPMIPPVLGNCSVAVSRRPSIVTSSGAPVASETGHASLALHLI